MLFRDINFLDYAASRITTTLLSVFFNRNTLFGAQFSNDRMVASAYHFAQKLEEKKTENDFLNYLAIHAVEGMLFGFYNNHEENKNWTGFVHTNKINLFVKDAYHIAEKMVEKSQQVREKETDLNANNLQNTLFDHLTGLLNRRAIEEHLVRLLATSQLKREPLALLMGDMDHFMVVNDTHGHSRGDAVLQHVSGLLKAACREMDVASRWGGDEFLIVLPDTDVAEAERIAERLRAAVEANPVRINQDDSELAIQITISLGRCVWQPATSASSSGDDLKQQLLKQADEALFRAKSMGRNRVEMG